MQESALPQLLSSCWEMYWTAFPLTCVTKYSLLLRKMSPPGNRYEEFIFIYIFSSIFFFCKLKAVKIFVGHNVNDLISAFVLSSLFQSSFYTAGKNYLLRMCNGKDLILSVSILNPESIKMSVCFLFFFPCQNRSS